MRVFLLPITTRQALVYCQKLSQKPPAELSYVDKIQKKATETWADWESRDSGWQKKVVEYGNYGLQRVPYQEWGLKSFPSSNPTIQAEQVTAAKKFDVVFPKNVMQQADVPKVLQRLAKERKQLHYKRFIGSMVAVPFTLPFALIPIIPNIPGFYVAYRCWSHWKALKGSDHLDFLLDHKLTRPVSTSAIEAIYQKVAPNNLNSFTFPTRAQIEEGKLPEEQLLLPPGSHTLVAKQLGVPELSTEIERAVWQVQRAIEKQAHNDSELAKTKAELKSVGESDEKGKPTP